MSTLPFYLINAFTTDAGPFSGNQCAVVIFESTSDPRWSDDKYLLDVARDFNLAETAYIAPITTNRQGDGDCEYYLRWFTTETVSPISPIAE
jgi:predicted PhzF superfamily epimerase YddE/YHI9